MNVIGKCVITGLVSAAVTGVVTWFVTKKVVEKREYYKSIDLVDDALAEQKTYLENKFRANQITGTSEESIKPEETEKPKEEPEQKSESVTDVPLIENVNIEHTDYHSIVKTHYDIPEEFAEKSEPPITKKDTNKPILISYGQYMEYGAPRRIDLTYYVSDYTLNPDGSRTPCPIIYCPDEDRAWTESEIMTKLGYEWRTAFKDDNDEGYDARYGDLEYDEDEVIVADRVNGLAYYIAREHKFYKVDILEMDEDAPYDYDEVFD